MTFLRPCLDCGRKTRAARCPDCARKLHQGANLNLAVWRRRSTLERTEHPLCLDHLERGEYVPATQTHHVIKRACGGELLSDELMTLCAKCHSVRTRRGE